jgi:hypothetical protein
MSNPPLQLRPKQTLLLILLPMLGTFMCQRLYLHLVRVQHIYPGGYLVHHLFVGVLIQIPAAFLLAFGTRNRLLAILSRVAVGIGSAMILDEVTYLGRDQGHRCRLRFPHFTVRSHRIHLPRRHSANGSLPVAPRLNILLRSGPNLFHSFHCPRPYLSSGFKNLNVSPATNPPARLATR